MKNLTRVFAIRQPSVLRQNARLAHPYRSYSQVTALCKSADIKTRIPFGRRSISASIYTKEMANSRSSMNVNTALETPDPSEKVDLRRGLIESVTRHPEADKLLLLSVDIGESNDSSPEENKCRTIVSGLADHYLPEQLKGMNIVVFANLKPRKLRGIESQGMLLAASYTGDKTGEGETTRVEVLEAPAVSKPGEKVFAASVHKLYLAGEAFTAKPLTVSQRVAKTFLQNLALNAGVISYQNERLVTELGKDIRTRTMLCGNVG